MNTDQTRESSWGAAEPVLHESLVIPKYDESSLSEALRTADSQAIEFRVTRQGSPARRMRLSGDRYTLGSAQGCSIQLSDPAVRPTHAVLTRKDGRALVRGSAGPIVVNDRSVTEAELHPGDVLQLGAYQFELCSVVAEPSDESLDAMIRAERIRQDLEQLRELQADCERRITLCDERESLLRELENEIWARTDLLDRREASLQASQADQVAQTDSAAGLQHELESVREELVRRQQDFHQRERDFRQQESEFRKRLEETNRQLRRSEKQAETANEAVARMREQFDQLNQQVEALLGQQTGFETREQNQRAELEQLVAQAQEKHRADVESLRSSLSERETEIELLREQVLQLQQRLEETSETSYEPTDETSEPAVASIWRDTNWDEERPEESRPIEGASDADEFRLEELEEGQFDFVAQRDDVDAEDVEPSVSSVADSTIRNQSIPIDRPSSGFADANEEEDDSIEAYMNRLLRRVQGRPLDESTVSSASTVKLPVPDKTVSTQNVVLPETPARPNRLDPNTPLVPRSQAPEKGTSLTAMRELANASARIAISNSVRVQNRNTQLRAAFSIACAIGAAICGVACYLLLPGIMRYLSVAMTFVVASISLYEGVILFRSMDRPTHPASVDDDDDISG